MPFNLTYAACQRVRLQLRRYAHPDERIIRQLHASIALLPDLHDRLRCYALLRIV